MSRSRQSRFISHGASALSVNAHAVGGEADVRREIAEYAARLIAEGLLDYRAAKSKAAKALNATDSATLPGNQEIEAALREYLTLFEAESQPLELAALRTVAIKAMEWLADFSPWISGSVLKGTANGFSVIDLEVISADSKQFELFLLNEGVDFESAGGQSSAAKSRQHRSQPLSYAISVEDAPVEITIFDNHAARLAHFPRAHPRHRRVQCDEAIRYFEAQHDDQT